MVKYKLFKIVAIHFIVFSSTLVTAENFWISGKINRTLVDNKYGECMIRIDKVVNNGCPSNGWISLDCKDTFYPAGQGDRKFTTALAAAFSENLVSVLVSNDQKHNGYCVARRIDIRF